MRSVLRLSRNVLSGSKPLQLFSKADTKSLSIFNLSKTSRLLHVHQASCCRLQRSNINKLHTDVQKQKFTNIKTKAERTALFQTSTNSKVSKATAVFPKTVYVDANHMTVHGDRIFCNSRTRIAEYTMYGQLKNVFPQFKHRWCRYPVHPPDSNLYVCDTEHHCYHDMAVHPHDSNLYVCDTEHHYYHDMAVHPHDSNLYVCDTEHHCIHVFTLNGVYVKHFGPYYLQNPTDLAIHSLSGDIFVSNRHRIVVFDSDGIYKRSLDNIPTGSDAIAVDPQEDELYVHCKDGIHIYTTNGAYRRSIDRTYWARGIAIHSFAPHVFVTFLKHIAVYHKKTGKWLFEIYGSSDGLARFRYLEDISIHHRSGCILVSDDSICVHII